MSEAVTQSGQIKCTVLWNGGWDVYLIDINQVVSLPEGKEPKIGSLPIFVVDGGRYFHSRYLNRDWYRDTVLPLNPASGAGIHPDNTGVSILRHLGGGD